MPRRPKHGGTERSRFPVQEGPSRYDREARRYRFEHTETDSRQGVRGFFAPALEATKWHQDVQVDQQGERNYATYLAKYASKFSDSVHDELLEGDAEANTLAASVLSRYRPAVPEMLLQLFSTVFKQWSVSTWSRGRKDFRPPLPDDEALPAEVHAYINSRWRRDEMTLLEFLRKTNDQGEVAGWVKEKWKLSGAAGSLEQFANDVAMDGEKIVACEMGSRLKDRFYGQWLVLFVPFRDLAEFKLTEVAARVPKTDRYLAACVACTHAAAQAMWGNLEALEESLRVEGHGAVHRRMVMDHVRTQTELIKQYLSGRRAVLEAPERPELQGRVVRLPIRQKYADFIAAGAKTVEGRLNQGAAATLRAGDTVQFGGNLRARVEWAQHYGTFRDMLEDVGYQNAVPDAWSLGAAVKAYLNFPRYRELEAQCGVIALGLSPQWEQGEGPEENAEQRRWRQVVQEDLERVLWARAVVETSDFDRAREACWAANKLRVLEGPPGTGKTTTAKAAVLAAAQQGAQILWTGYTAQLAARARAVLPEVVAVDTCHAALGLDLDLVECKYFLARYDLVVVDEFSQLRGQDLHHVWKLMEAVDHMVVVCLLGDRFQYAGFGDRRVWQMPIWNQAHLTKLHQVYRCVDPDFQRILTTLRTSKPSATGAGGTVSVAEIMKHRRAWRGHTPKEEDIARLLSRHPETTFLAITRRGADYLKQPGP